MQVVERIGKREENWDGFIQSLPDDEYRYCVFDFEFTKEDGMHISKMVFVNWSPDAAPIKARMLYATAKEAFKKYLDLMNKDHTLSSKGDVPIHPNPDDRKRHDQRTIQVTMLSIYPIINHHCLMPIGYQLLLISN